MNIVTVFVGIIISVTIVILNALKCHHAITCLYGSLRVTRKMVVPELEMNWIR